MKFQESERGYPPVIRDSTGEAVSIGYALMNRVADGKGGWVGDWHGERRETIPEAVYAVGPNTPADVAGVVQVAVAAYSSGTVALLSVGGVEGMHASAAGQVFLSDWEGCAVAALSVVFPESWGKLHKFAAAVGELHDGEGIGPFPPGSERQKLMIEMVSAHDFIHQFAMKRASDVVRLGGPTIGNEFAQELGDFCHRLTRLQFRALHSFYHHQEREKQGGDHARD